MAERLTSRAADGDDILPYLRDHYELEEFPCRVRARPLPGPRGYALLCHVRRFYYLHHRRARDLAIATRHHVEVIRAVAKGNERKGRRRL